MSLTDAEIIELESLLAAREIDERIEALTNLTEETSPNYKLLYEAVNTQKWGTDENGRPKLLEGYVGVVLEGSSRSTKTWSGVFLIMYLALIRHKVEGCTINIYRETYNEFKTTLYDDFKRVLDMFGLPNKFKETDEVKNFKIGNSKVYFLGDGKHGGGCDYAFFNEVMMQKQSVFDQVEMRCRIFWWMDYNPSFTEHWVFNRILSRKDVAFLRTTFRNNKFISASELNKILSYEPWEPGSYEVTPEGDLLYLSEPISDNNTPPPHKQNIEQGTADEYMWKVYGLGLRGAMQGQIFKLVHWIDKFPNLAFTWGLDFGFTCFTGDTLITTSTGDVPIKDVRPGDFVLTRMGYKKVLNNFNNGEKEVITKKIDLDVGYREITATFSHNFNVDYKWKKFGELEKMDNLCVLLSSTVMNSGGIQVEKTQTTISESGKNQEYTINKGFIKRFISFTKEKFQKVMLFITSMITLLITTLIIWLVSLPVNMRKFIKYLIDICKRKNQKSIGRKTDIVSQIGMKEGKLFCQTLKTKSEHALIVTPISHQQTPIKNSVQANATTVGSMLQRLIKLKCNARLAVTRLWLTSISNKKHAATSVRMTYQSVIDLKEISRNKAAVYDLHVEGVHEYFANGILVHNCDQTALVKFAKEGRNIYLELMIYQPIATPDELDAALISRNVSKYVPITADSSDRYVSERHGVVQMVRDLFDRGWEISKVSKTKSIMYWITEMKSHRIHIVKNDLWHKFKSEQENYRFKEVNGILINQPIDGHDHAFSASRYALMSHALDNLEADFS